VFSGLRGRGQDRNPTTDPAPQLLIGLSIDVKRKVGGAEAAFLPPASNNPNPLHEVETCSDQDKCPQVCPFGH